MEKDINGFFEFLPMAELNVIQKKTPKEPETRPSSVVIMEKYDFSAMVLSSILSATDLNLKVVNDPQNLEAELDKELPSILFYDLDVGSENDKEVLKKIQEKFPNLKIILIIWVGQEISRNKLFEEYNVKGVVQRPFSRREVLGILE
tara:strand:- start:6568 stop:7008 length:441 start_codon:yes stop_codon:yes gene_type:complete